MSIQKSDIPFGSEFSPNQISLRELLEFADQHGGDWRAFEDAVYHRYFTEGNAREIDKRKKANNSKLGLQGYGIVDDDANLTEFGRVLFDVKDDDQALYRELAIHILTQIHGVSVIQCAQDMQAAGDTIDLTSFREALDERGIHVPRGGRHLSSYRLWLEKAGVVLDDDWRINERLLSELLGLESEDIEALTSLKPELRYFVRTLARIGDGQKLRGNQIEKLATATYGVRYNEKSLSKDVLKPLEKLGFIELERGTVEAGRGARSPFIHLTDKLRNEVIEPLLAQVDKLVKPEIRPLLRLPLSEILENLENPSTYERGLALEALAFKLLRLIDLKYVGTRVRRDFTGGAEVDLMFHSDRLVYSRWQIQCKHKPSSSVTLDDVAKEVGLTHMLKSNVIVILTTGKVGRQARKYATHVMRDSNLCIVMLDSVDVRSIVDDATSIVPIFQREARHAMRIKSPDADTREVLTTADEEESNDES